jgi:hypothetical protein
MNNNVNGIRASGVGSTGGIRVTMIKSTAAGNSTNGITATSPGGATIGMFVVGSVSASNQNGVVSDGNQAFINIDGNSIVNNTGAGLSTSNSGTIASFTVPNNAVIANAPDGSPTNNALVFK